MKIAIFLALIICVPAQSAEKIEGQIFTYKGPWVTTNRKLDGIMTAIVTRTGEEAWKGRFYGVWQGVSFDYTVKFTGPPDDLKGKATIDFASYTWKGKIAKVTPGTFTATFTGNRYTGYFNMKEVVKKK